MITGANGLTGDEFMREERRWQREQQERDDRLARQQAERRTERIKAVAAATAVIMVAAIIAAVSIWIVTTNAEHATRRNLACVESGGTLMAIGGAGGEQVCARISIEVPK